MTKGPMGAIGVADLRYHRGSACWLRLSLFVKVTCIIDIRCQRGIVIRFLEGTPAP